MAITIALVGPLVFNLVLISLVLSGILGWGKVFVIVCGITLFVKIRKNKASWVRVFNIAVAVFGAITASVIMWLGLIVV